MKLYYAPGTCALASHIALNESGLKYEAIKVDLSKKLTADGADFNAINAKGYVPALQLDDGEVITEGPAVLQYIADQMPASKLAPAWGTHARYHLIEWLNFISTELHKQFSPLFHKPTDEIKEKQTALISRRFAYVNEKLAGKSFVMGQDFTVADAYMFVVLRWASRLGFDFTQWPALNEYFARLLARPTIQAAMQEEGLKS